MIISYLWISEWLDHGLSPRELADGLTSLGLETSFAQDRRGAFENFVVGEVLSVAPHPDADKLNVASVSVGRGESLSIVCGAPNVAQGQVVPVALPGAVLPSGLKIEKRELRGVPSEGMICSESELGVSEEAQGIMVLDGSCEAGEPLSKHLELEDVLLEVDLTPNRGDCLGLIGIARELSALTGAKIKLPEVLESTGGEIEGFKVEVNSPHGCPRYTAREISGAAVKPSPVKIRRRLSAVGIRPINNIVDVTNYVMLETGHPLHAFDRRTLDGGKIVVRDAGGDGNFTTLDGRTHELKKDMLVIADGKKAVALAGVMGGANSEIQPDTSDIILESAYFDPTIIRRTAKRLGISTESSYRFERGVNPETVDFASHRAAKLILELAGGTAGGFVDEYPGKRGPLEITLRTDRVNRLLGLELENADVGEMLERLGFDHGKPDNGVFNVTCPLYRHDIKEETDLVEEVARLHGYGNIPTTVARLAQHETTGEVAGFLQRKKLCYLLSYAGFTETVNYSFINPQWRRKLYMDKQRALELENPINADWSEMRTSLLPALLTNAGYNLRQGQEHISIFETGTVFLPEGENGVTEEFRTAALMTGGKEPVFNIDMPRDFFRMKGALAKVIKGFCGFEPVTARPKTPLPFLYPHRQVDIFVRGSKIGFMGQIHTLP